MGRGMVSACRRLIRSGLMLIAVVAAGPLHAAVSSSERSALINFYNATQGSQWTTHAGWLGSAGTECYWTGVTCDSSQSTVVGLNLANNNLHGSLSALTSFTNLATFDVSQNVLTGSIPALTGLTKLQVFNVWSNQLSGSLPDLTGLTALREFRTWSNQLTGSIPALTSTTNLTVFDTQYNQLTGSIPALAQLSALKELIVSNNQLSGSLPSLAGLANLQKLDVSFNSLSGAFPALASNTSLQTLYTDHNNFSGSLPAPPATLGLASLCPDALLTQTASTTWDLLSGQTPWYRNCGGMAQLMVSNVNNGVSPAVGAVFPVTISALDTNGQPAIAAPDYFYAQLVLVQGSGQLYSQSGLQCYFPTGGSSCTVSGVSYSVAETGVQIRAASSYSTPTYLTPASAPFTVVPGSYTVGGTVSGLTGSGLVLSLYPGSQRLAISANGSFAFPLALGNGASYSVSVLSQPNAPLQQCTVQQGSGNIYGSSISNIQVNCVPLWTVTVTANNGNNYYSGSAYPATQTVPNGTAANITISANSNFYPQVSAHGCSVARNNNGYWATSALNSDCQITVVFTPTQYVPLNPVRLVDTRSGGTTTDGLFASTGPLAANVPFSYTILGRGGVPSSGVAAIVLNVTATNAGGPGYLTAWPTCSTRPLSSNLNFVAQQPISNLVIVAASCDATSSLFASIGTDAMVDVVGYFRTGPNVTPMVPARLLDTRPGATTVDGISAGAGSAPTGNQINLQVAGRAGIPSSGASAIALNTTVTNTSSAGYVTVWPTDQPRPLASNLNFVPGETVPNLVIAKLSAAGQISLYNSSGPLDLVADATAWFPASSNLTPITPARLMDTRTGASTIDGVGAGGGPVSNTAARFVSVTGRGGVPAYGVGAVVLNVTAVNPSASGSLSVSSQCCYQALLPNLYYAAGQTVPNLVIVPPGYNGISVSASAGSTTDVVIDVVGWFVGP